MPNPNQQQPMKQKQVPPVDLVEEAWDDPGALAEKRALAVLKSQNIDLANVHIYFGSRKEEPSVRRSMGYEPVLENGKQLTDRGDPIWFIAKDISDRRLAAPGILAQQQLRKTMRGEDKEYKTRDQEGHVHGLSPA